MQLNPNFDHELISNYACFQICHQASQDHPIITETYFITTKKTVKLTHQMPVDGRQLISSNNTMIIIHKNNVYYPRNGELFLVKKNIGRIQKHHINGNGSIRLFASKKNCESVTTYHGSLFKLSHMKTLDIM